MINEIGTVDLSIVVVRIQDIVLFTTDETMEIRPELLAVLQRTIEKIHDTDQYVKYRRECLLRAFVTWSRCAPLIQICGELKRQLQERSSVFELLRESYLRDVVSVKHHLDKIAPLGQFFVEDLKVNLLCSEFFVQRVSHHFC